MIRLALTALLCWGQIVFAATFNSTINVQSISVQKPTGNPIVANEALTSWLETDVRVGSGGLWGSTHFVMSLTPGGQSYLDSGNTYSVYATGVPGVGFVLGVSDCDEFLSGFNCKSLNPINGPGDYTLADHVLATDVIFRYFVKLVTTGDPLQSGSGGSFHIGSSALHSASVDSNAVTLGAFSVVFTQQSCAIQASPTVINMGVVAQTQFTGLNSTVNGPPVTVNLTCSPGLNNVFAVMSDVNNSANTTNILTVTGGATGVGLRFVRDNGSVVTYSPDASYIGAPNQWQVNTTAETDELTFTLTPQYIQTQNTIGVGDANGLASITLSYD